MSRRQAFLDAADGCLAQCSNEKTGTGGAGAAIAALTAITIMAGGVAAAPTQTVRVGDLTVTHEPSGIAWLDGRRLHTPRGDVVRLPWTKKQVRTTHPRILGHRPHAWLVKDFTGDTWNVWAVSGGKRAKLFSVGIADGEEATIVVARDSRRIAVSDFDGSNSALLEVYNGRGDLVASRTFDGDGAVLDFSGPRAVVGTSDTQVWDIDSDSLTDLGVDASGASIDNNLLLVRDSVSGEVGPTPLNNPGTPAWTARMVEPRITPGGGRLVSRADRFA